MIYITTKQTEREVTKMEKLVDLYIDVDDVILNTSETFIDYYTKKNNIHKSFYDLKDWDFRSIDRNIDKQEFFDYVYNKEFLDNVQINEAFMRFYMKEANNYKWHFVTIDSSANLFVKRYFILNSLPTLMNVDFIGLIEGQKKSDIDMTDGIQIDDRYDNLNTNATYKILLKNYIETDYNQLLDMREDVYITNTFDEVVESIKFLSQEIKENFKKRELSYE